jgi:hypothetical protein
MIILGLLLLVFGLVFDVLHVVFHTGALIF